MKFFGWGRKKDPPPTRHDEVKQSDGGASARSIRDPGIAESPELLSKDYWLGGEMAAQELAWEDRLQETIRFVFSHEQEGLLAIGTFALDQLAEACLGLDMIKPPTTTTTISDQRSCINSSSNCVPSSMQVLLRELRSSDVDDSVPELFSPCKRKDLPVFGDHDELLPVVDTAIQLLPIHVLKGSNTPDQADTEGLVTQTVQQKREKPGVVSLTTEHEELDYELPRAGCGLFGSRSRRTQKPGEKEKLKKLPPEKKQSTEVLNDVKNNSDRSCKGFRTSLARLWRSGCNGPPVEVTPEPDPSPSQMQVPGVPCIANVELELPVLPKAGPSQPLQKASEGGERRRRRSSFGKGTWACAQNGKWIRTDSEFVVLEM